MLPASTSKKKGYHGITDSKRATKQETTTTTRNLGDQPILEWNMQADRITPPSMPLRIAVMHSSSHPAPLPQFSASAAA